MTAQLALLIWPLVAIAFFRKMPIPTAVAATIIGGYLLLPTRTGWDFPVLPSLDKGSIPALMALLLTAVYANKPSARDTGILPGWVPKDPVTLCLVGFILLGVFPTTLTNRDFIIGSQGLRIYDAFSMGLGLLMMLIPFLIARRVFASREGQEQLVRVLIFAALAYSLLALWEVRMSPQLNRQIYGFFSHSFLQHMRGGGFRPVVFLSHGLWLGIFLCTAAVAAFAMFRGQTGRQRHILLAAGLWLTGTIFLSKVLGAFMILMVMIPICLFLSQRLQVLAALSIAALVLFYPTLRAIDVVPVDRVVNLAYSIDPQRAESLSFRLFHEDALLEKARQRPLFGWGSYGRNRIYDENGQDISVTDGFWVIHFGVGGWVRYIGIMGLLTWGIVGQAVRGRKASDPVSIALTLALAANLVDLLPNAGVSSVTWLLAGALAGRLELVRDGDAPLAATATPASPRFVPTPEPAGQRYTRQTGQVHRRSHVAEAPSPRRSSLK